MNTNEIELIESTKPVSEAVSEEQSPKYREYTKRDGSISKYPIKTKTNRKQILFPSRFDNDVRANRYNDVVSILRDADLIQNKTYKEITKLINTKLHTNYSLNSIYHIIRKLDIKRNMEIETLNENLRSYLLDPKNTEHRSILQIRSEFNKKYNVDVSRTKVTNFIHIIESRKREIDHLIEKNDSRIDSEQ